MSQAAKPQRPTVVVEPLWQVAGELRDAQRQMEDDGGVTPEQEARLDAAWDRLEQKMDQCALVVRAWDKEIAAYTVEIDRLTAARKRMVGAREALLAYMLHQMVRANVHEVRSPDGLRKWVRKKNPGTTIITDEESLPLDVFVPQPDVVDKRLLRSKYLDRGVPVFGAYIKPSERLEEV